MRTHIVMVPGFGGFDALGDLRYYSGVTELFEPWRKAANQSVALHYFDNLPTAAVATRARDLENYLIKLVDRGVIVLDDNGDGDKIVLVGHSTGGLDIRHVLRQLRSDEPPERRAAIYQRLDHAIGRVVFLSVPQLGTNIADFVAAYDRAVAILLFAMRYAPWFVGRGIKLLKWTQMLGPSQLLDEAIDDVYRELEIPANPWRAAEARRTEADLRLWRRHAASDFLAIGDLATAHLATAQLAGHDHLPARARAAINRGATPGTPVKRLVDEALAGTSTELDGREVLSFATCAPNPFNASVVHGGELRSIGVVKDLANGEAVDRTATDLLFRFAYAACSAGPFSQAADARWFRGCAPEGVEDPTFHVEPWQNDGIVNTASALWRPHAQSEAWLVCGDHADIIGHYRKKDAPGPDPRDSDAADSLRLYQAYDLLGANSKFEARFAPIWNRVFEFAVDGLASAKPAIAGIA